MWRLSKAEIVQFAGTTATSSSSIQTTISSENTIPRSWLWIDSLSTSTAVIDPLPLTPAPAEENRLLEHYIGSFQKRANTDTISSYISETSTLSLPTSCIPSSLLDSCPASCSSNANIAKCTDLTAPYCSSSPYTSSSGATIILMTRWGCAPTPFTAETASTTQSSTLIPINSTTATSTTQLAAPTGSSSSTSKSFPTGKQPSYPHNNKQAIGSSRKTRLLSRW